MLACHNTLAQAPIMCFQEREIVPSRFSREAQYRCTCWPRRDWFGLTDDPHKAAAALSQIYPLDREYPGIPREYNGNYFSAFDVAFPNVAGNP